MRFRQLHCVTIVVTMLVVGACDSLRPHDEARAKTAAELVTISATITEGGEFEAMKENLKPVIAAQTRLQKLERANDWEAYCASKNTKTNYATKISSSNSESKNEPQTSSTRDATYSGAWRKPVNSATKKPETT